MDCKWHKILFERYADRVQNNGEPQFIPASATLATIPAAVAIKAPGSVQRVFFTPAAIKYICRLWKGMVIFMAFYFQYLSEMMIPLLIFSIVGYGILMRRIDAVMPIYESGP